MTCGACSARLRQLLLISDGFARTRWGSAAAVSASSLRFWTVARRIGCCVVGVFLPDSRRRAAVRRWQLILLLLYDFARGSAAARLRQRLVSTFSRRRAAARLRQRPVSYRRRRSDAMRLGCGSDVATSVSFRRFRADAPWLGCGSVYFFSTTSRGLAAAWLRQRLVLARRLHADAQSVATASGSRRARAGRAGVRMRQRLGFSDDLARTRCDSVAAASDSSRRLRVARCGSAAVVNFM